MKSTKCEDASAALVALHFGTIDGDERDAIEAHLIACSACVRDYLALKRAIEAPEESEAPSETSRAKLRRSVERALAREGAARWRWWERPVATALAAASVIVGLRLVQTIASSEGRAPHAMRDGQDARSTPR